MEFKTLGKEERKLLLTALDIDYNNLECWHCSKKVKFETCGIMPPVGYCKGAIILCNSPLCMTEYLTEIEDEKKFFKEEV